MTLHDSITLASASPRRSQLLTQIGVRHLVRATDIDEALRPGEPVEAYVARLAASKAEVAWDADGRRPVLAADTAVALGAELFGKPEDLNDGVRILSALAGRTHRVLTAVAVRSAAGLGSALSVSEVTFRALSDAECRRYWASGEPRGKAGGYAIQGLPGSLTLPRRGRAPVEYGGGRLTAEILVNVTPRESRAAFLENGVLQEVHIERANRRGITSNVYKGRVSRVLPGMQAAFIDVGLDRTAFLHVSDIARREDVGVEFEAPHTDDIRAAVSEGDELLVQVLKDPLGTKGARLTTFITLPSRFLVYMPQGRGVGVSARIEDEMERARLRTLVETFMPAERPGGYIIRTVAEGVVPEALRADMLFLQRLWELVGHAGLAAPAGRLVHEDLPLHVRMLRDLLGQDVERVQVDAPAAYTRMLEFARTFMPESESKIELYRGNRPIFDLYGVEDEIQKALDRKVPLKSGGYLIIDQTEAMTTIDVNTGAFVGHRNLEDTIFRTNLEAAVAIARQLRLRNLGGIIIIDFIDMQDEDHRRQVLQALEKSLATDHARTHISSVSPLGLVEMTRKRTRESLEHLLCCPCPTCEGRRYVKTPETVAYEIFREIVRQARQFEVQGLMVLAHQDVIELLLDEESAALGELEVLVGKPIRLQTEALYAQDQYDVVLL